LAYERQQVPEKRTGSLAIFSNPPRLGRMYAGRDLFETIAITTSPEPPFMLPRSTRRRCTTDHKFGIHRHNGWAGFQIASSFERAA
jgi:hypothetical protein